VAGHAAEGTLIAPVPKTAGGGTPVVALERGRDYLVEVVTRTRNIGHFFPGGTVDAFDVWVELKGEDENGRVVYWSGWTEDHGGRRGPVDPGAHFFRSFLLDAQGNHINKRNAWSARAMLYARLIPPGAADTAHFRVRLPEEMGERLRLTAKVNYRKFMWWNTQWSYAGVRDAADPHPDVTPHYDSGRWVFEGDTSKVSGNLKEIPDLPIIELSTDVKDFVIVAAGAAPAHDLDGPAASDPKTRERWNDYGIGLLRQGDFKGATDAFNKVTQIDPAYVDGWVNIARARIDEGAHREAAALLEKALEMSPDLPRALLLRADTQDGRQV
jgi:tetratricopeptide (TPR) repeat protein